MLLFYNPELDGEQLTLDAENARHAVKVLRLDLGEELHLTDGKGQLVKARISAPDAKRCLVEVLERKHLPQRAPGLTLAVAPTKNIARFEWFLEKATEIGVERIVPILCERSERKVIKPERLEKVLVSAMKQSLKTWKPKLEELTRFSDLVQAPFNGPKAIAWMEEQEPAHLLSLLKGRDDALILIGPEGDFSPNEVQLAKSNGFQPISLGPSRLRTETAAIVACHTFALQQFL